MIQSVGGMAANGRYKIKEKKNLLSNNFYNMTN